jgi:hypothetical protein
MGDFCIHCGENISMFNKSKCSKNPNGKHEFEEDVVWIGRKEDVKYKKHLEQQEEIKKKKKIELNETIREFDLSEIIKED